jgi:hypothetical protein
MISFGTALHRHSILDITVPDAVILGTPFGCELSKAHSMFLIVMLHTSEK